MFRTTDYMTGAPGGSYNFSCAEGDLTSIPAAALGRADMFLSSEQMDALFEASKAPWQEYWYWWSQIALTLIALVSAVIALVQLNWIRQSREDAVRTARATFLFELDRRWNSTNMVNAKIALNKSIDAAKEAVSREHLLVNDGEKERLVGIEFSQKLGELRKSDTDAYQRIMSICGFFEAAGLMVKREYIPAADIIALYGGPLVGVNAYYRAHIVERQNETGVLAGLYEHALDLAAKVRPPR